MGAPVAATALARCCDSSSVPQSPKDSISIFAAWKGYLDVRGLRPCNAPSFYRFDFSAGSIATNALQYLDRTATFAAVVALFWLLLTRQRLPLTSRSKQVIVFATLWWTGTLAITVLLPVRSSLYACLPSVGVALMVATSLTESFSLVPTVTARRAVAAGLLLPFLLSPVYDSRARRTRMEAELSTTTLATLQQVATRLGPGTSVRLFDNRAERPSLLNPFGVSIQEAADLMIRPHIAVWIEPPPDDAALAGLTPPPHFDIDLSLQNGKIIEGRTDLPGSVVIVPRRGDRPGTKGIALPFRPARNHPATPV